MKPLSICLVDYKKAGDFFIQLAKSDDSRTYHIITTLLSIHKKAKQESIDSHLIKSRKSLANSHANLENTRERKLGILSEEESLALFNAIEEHAKKILNTLPPGALPATVLVWNGATVMGEAARRLKSSANIRTLFFEIANIPGKIFVDPQGVNSQSKLYTNPEILERFEASIEDYTAWRDQYIESKKKTSTVPQAALGKKLNTHHILDFIYCSTLGFRTFSNSSVSGKIRNIFSKPSSPPPQHGYSTNLPNTFWFFPMQVSNDTQLLINSDINNIQALEYLIKTTKNNIVIKPHPAETDTNYIFKYIHASNESKVWVTKENTYDLIKKASAVVTINSTTGLEALILEKPTKFLGKSFYSHLTQETLKNYIINYLINIDFFAIEAAKISKKEISEIYSRCAE